MVNKYDKSLPPSYNKRHMLKYASSPHAEAILRYPSFPDLLWSFTGSDTYFTELQEHLYNIALHSLNILTKHYQGIPLSEDDLKSHAKDIAELLRYAPFVQ